MRVTPLTSSSPTRGEDAEVQTDDSLSLAVKKIIKHRLRAVSSPLKPALYRCQGKQLSLGATLFLDRCLRR